MSIIKLLSGGGAGGRKCFGGSGSASIVPDNITWMPREVTATRNYKRCAMSRNGQYQVVAVKSAGLFYSHDYGLTWAASTLAPVLSGDWMSVCCSETGDYFYAAAMSGTTGIYKSTDRGVNFTQIYTDADNSLIDVKCSRTGQHLLTAKSSGATAQNRRSIDYGATWQNSFPTTYNMKAAVSGTGQYMYLCRNTGVIYKNNNYGDSASWDAGTTIDAAAVEIAQLRCSYNSQYLMAYLGTRGLYTSADSGATWTRRIPVMSTPGGTFEGGDVQLSSDGKIQAFCGPTINYQNGYLAVSEDYGVHWKWFLPDVPEWTIDFSDNFRYVLRPINNAGIGYYYGFILIKQ